MADSKIEDSGLGATHLEEPDNLEGLKTKTVVKENVAGTVKLSEGATVYIPRPTADPQGMLTDPLNMMLWQKMMIHILISIFATLGVSLVSGFGGLLEFYIPDYAAHGKDYDDITHLMTYPSLFMGIGNLIAVPIAIGVGRRIVFLVSTVLLIVATVLCAVAKTYEWHLGARLVLGLAAGQSEALVPLMAQEIFFLHERGRALMIQHTLQVTLTTIWVLFASQIAAAITPGWWYGLGAVLAGVQLVLSVFFLPETKYKRPAADYQNDAAHAGGVAAVEVFTVRPELDPITYAPRTWRTDLRLWVGKPNWAKVRSVFVETFTLLLFPNVFWALCLNGLTLGANIAIGTTYSSIISKPPYSWPQKTISYVNCGQIVTAIVALPIFGHGSDRLIKWFAKRRNGLHEPEVRIYPLALPIIIGTMTAVLYGQGATHREDYHWFLYVWVIAAYNFCFSGANIISITYLLDAYPSRSGPLLVIICAFRGIISFGVSYGISPFIDRCGFDGAFGIFGGLTAVFGLMGIPLLIWGKDIRRITTPYVQGSVE